MVSRGPMKRSDASQFNLASSMTMYSVSTSVDTRFVFVFLLVCVAALGFRIQIDTGSRMGACACIGVSVRIGTCNTEAYTVTNSILRKNCETITRLGTCSIGN